MPVYNNGDVVERTINSILKQTFTDFELLCINDCSPDNSLNVLNKIAEKDSRIRVFSNEINRGAGYCRNYGLNFAKGDYCFFLDGDDFFEPVFIEKMYGKIVETDADVCFCNYTFVKTDGTLKNTTKFAEGITTNPFSPQDIQSSLFQLNHAVPWNKIYRVDFIKKHGFKFEELSSSNDLTFTLSVFTNAKKIAFVEDSLIRYTKGDFLSTTRSLKDSHVDNVFKAYDALVRNIGTLPNFTDIVPTLYKALERSLNYRLGLKSNFILHYHPELSKCEALNEYIGSNGLEQSLVNTYINDLPFITVILFIRDSHDISFIPDTLESVLNQSFFKFTVKVINTIRDEEKYKESDLLVRRYAASDSRIEIVNDLVSFGEDDTGTDDDSRNIASGYDNGSHMVEEIVNSNSDADGDDYVFPDMEEDEHSGSNQVDVLYGNEVLKNLSTPYLFIAEVGEIFDKEMFCEMFYSYVGSDSDVVYCDYRTLVGHHYDYKTGSGLASQYGNLSFIKARANDNLFASVSNKLYRSIVIIRNGIRFRSDYTFVENFCLYADRCKELKENWVTETGAGHRLNSRETAYSEICSDSGTDTGSGSGLHAWRNVKGQLSKVFNKKSLKSTDTDNPKISIVIPVYNVEKFLVRTLKSACNQTFKDIEIICVDDCSTDTSPDILKIFARIDSRIKILSLKENSSALIARKTGVLASHGDYVMFLDGDDELKISACETAYNEICKQNVDLLMFGTEVINYRGLSSEKRVKGFMRFVTPYEGFLEAGSSQSSDQTVPDSSANAMAKASAGDASGTDDEVPLTEDKTNNDLLKTVFVDRKFSFNIWNKIYKGDICREAFRIMPEIKFRKANDVFAMAYILSKSKTYYGIADQLYSYKLGSGVTGLEKLSQDDFNTLLTASDVNASIEQYLLTLSSDHKIVADSIKEKLLSENVGKFITHTDNTNNRANFEEIIKRWGYDDVVKCLAAKFWDEPKLVSRKVKEYFEKSREKHPVKTLAFYYRTICNGGAQRVTQMLCNLLSEAKDADGNSLYKIVLITDGDVMQMEYPLNEGIERAFLPPKDETHDKHYKARYDKWREIITTYHIDAVVTGHWMDSCVFWDLMAVKSCPGVYYIVHAHNFFAVPFIHIYGYKTVNHVLSAFDNCDGIVNLSEYDEAFASMHCRNSKYIPNPVTVDPVQAVNSKLNNNTICWVGRISREKQPVDLIKAMGVVVEAIPDAKLLIVGTGNKNILNEMIQLVSDYGIQDNVEFVGFSLNISRYYLNSSVFINTSRYEGFSQTFSESMSHGVPIVTYDMPWLTFIRNNKGIVTVEQGDYVNLARKVVELLNDRERLTELGRLAKENVTSVAKVDLTKEWGDFLDNVSACGDTTNDKEKEVNIELQVEMLKQKKFLMDSIIEFSEEFYNSSQNASDEIMEQLTAEKDKNLRIQKNSDELIARMNTETLNTLKQKVIRKKWFL